MIHRLVRRAFGLRRATCPDCPHDLNIHGRYGCLGSDLARSPAPPCQCKRTTKEKP